MVALISDWVGLSIQQASLGRRDPEEAGGDRGVVRRLAEVLRIRGVATGGIGTLYRYTHVYRAVAFTFQPIGVSFLSVIYG
jgi:hypothetical protein